MYKIPANTLLLGKNLVFVPECHSTNDEALQLTQKSSISEGTVIITNNQTAGRGQRGNTWQSLPGMNLTFSLILKPKTLAVKDQFYLNIITSLAVHDYIKQKTDALVQIKWPNDVMVNSRKICGILIENQLQGSRFTHTVVGIGLNINQQEFVHPLATSLNLITNAEYDLSDELDILLYKMEARYLQLHQGNYQMLKDEYHSCLFWLRQPHVFLSRKGEFEGMIMGIDEHGRLKIETLEDEKVFDLKEISYIK